MPESKQIDILCFSHLRWNFVYQRPQHLMTRFASKYRVFFIEEPVFDASTEFYDLKEQDNVWIVVPHLPPHLSTEEILHNQRELLSKLVVTSAITEYISWYYTPLALKYSDHLIPLTTVYDCMDELSAFKFAPPELIEYERQLLTHAAVVFTGGRSLYEAKKHLHKNIFSCPSSIDWKHFSAARDYQSEPKDQATIRHPKIGFFGVIDERFDINLIQDVALKRPDINFILIGPVVKIDPKELPTSNNIHYLGGKNYSELPQYLSGWDCAMIPFARNESTRFISPTKTPEYLSGGQPVISTSIQDVVHPYAKLGLVEIADTAEEFSVAIDKIMTMDGDEYQDWLDSVDQFLSETSWDKTFEAMEQEVQKCFHHASQKNQTQHV